VAQVGKPSTAKEKKKKKKGMNMADSDTKIRK
jgi:hypothetical protein